METAKFGPSSKNLDVRPPLHSNLRHLLVLLKESLLCLSPGGSDQRCSLLLGFCFRLVAHQLAKTRGLLDRGKSSGCRSWSSVPDVSLESASFFALRDIQLISRDKVPTSEISVAPIPLQPRSFAAITRWQPNLKSGEIEIVLAETPITKRGAFYRAVSAGLFPSTGERDYSKCLRYLNQLIERHRQLDDDMFYRHHPHQS